MIIKKGEVIGIASGIFEGYNRAGPYVSTREFDLAAFIEMARASNMEPWEISNFMCEIPRLLLEQGLVVGMPCRNVYLGAMGEFEIVEERDIFT